MISFRPEIGIREYVSQELKKYSHKYDDKLPWQRNILMLYNLRRRLPEAKPRSVIELPNIKIPEHLRDGYKGIIEKIRYGQSIRGHLSKTVAKVNFKDTLLNYWNIHHLHLSLEKHSDNFFARTGYVLFALFYDNLVVFIDVLAHPSAQNLGWVNIDLLEKIHKYFPVAIYEWQTNLKGNIFSPEQRKKLHDCNINYAIELSDGSTYMIPSMMSNGVHLHDSILVAKLIRSVDYFRELIRLNENDFKEIVGTDDELTVLFQNNQLVLFSTKNEMIIHINNG